MATLDLPGAERRGGGDSLKWELPAKISGKCSSGSCAVVGWLKNGPTFSQSCRLAWNLEERKFDPRDPAALEIEIYSLNKLRFLHKARTLLPAAKGAAMAGEGGHPHLWGTVKTGKLRFTETCQGYVANRQDQNLRPCLQAPGPVVLGPLWASWKLPSPPTPA